MRTCWLLLALLASACSNPSDDAQPDAGGLDAPAVDPDAFELYGFWHVRFDASLCGGSSVREDWVVFGLVDGQPAVTQWRRLVDNYSIDLLSTTSATVTVHADTETVTWGISDTGVSIEWTTLIVGGSCTVADDSVEVLSGV